MVVCTGTSDHLAMTEQWQEGGSGQRGFCFNYFIILKCKYFWTCAALLDTPLNDILKMFPTFCCCYICKWGERKVLSPCHAFPKTQGSTLLHHDLITVCGQVQSSEVNTEKDAFYIYQFYIIEKQSYPNLGFNYYSGQGLRVVIK